MRHLISQHSFPFFLTTFRKTILVQICELGAILDFLPSMSKFHNISFNKMSGIRLNCLFLIVNFFTNTAVFTSASIQCLINTTICLTHNLLMWSQFCRSWAVQEWTQPSQLCVAIRLIYFSLNLPHLLSWNFRYFCSWNFIYCPFFLSPSVQRTTSFWIFVVSRFVCHTSQI